MARQRKLSPERKAFIDSLLEHYQPQDAQDVQNMLKDLLGDTLQGMLEAEMDQKLGYSKYDYQHKDTDDSRNGYSKKTVVSSLGEIDLDIPRDRKGEFEPQIVRKNQTDISNIEDQVLSMYAKGMTTRDISSHLHDVYGVDASAEMISHMTDRILPVAKEWQNRPLERKYAVVFMDAVHFHSYPYTSERAYEKVRELAKILTTYTGKINMYSINLLPIQEQIVANCPEDQTTILVRRFMMRCAEKIAAKVEAMMLITGESLGQVASQTAEALVVTDSTVSMPVMRPLIAMDKTEIIRIAKEIGTFEKSIEPYEDCCTVFLPKHPVTKPKLEKILESESKLDVEALVDAAVESATLDVIYQEFE